MTGISILLMQFLRFFRYETGPYAIAYFLGNVVFDQQNKGLEVD